MHKIFNRDYIFSNQEKIIELDIHQATDRFMLQNRDYAHYLKTHS